MEGQASLLSLWLGQCEIGWALAHQVRVLVGQKAVAMCVCVCGSVAHPGAVDKVVVDGIGS